MNLLLVSADGKDFSIGEEATFKYRIAYVQNKEQALVYVRQNALLDIVVIDAGLPEDSAFELIREIRKTELGEDLIILLITGTEDYISEIEGLRLGADEYIRKPLKRESFLAVLKLYEKLILQKSEKLRFKEMAKVYDALFQQAPVGISISHNKDPAKMHKNEYFVANKNYMKILGRTKQELVEQSWYAITHPEDREKELKLYKDMQAGLIDNYELEKRFIKPDGSIVWCRVISTVLDLVENEMGSQLSIVENISEKKKMGLALNKSNKSMEVLLSNMPGMVYRCKYDENWTMEFLSDKCKRITGYEREKLLNNSEISYNDIIQAEYRSEIRKKWDENVNSERIVVSKYEILTAEGDVKWIYESGQGVLNENGEVTHIEGMIFDITEAVENEEELRFSIEHHMWTGLHNRRYFDSFYKQDSLNEGKKAIVLLNMSNMLSLNMSYGYNYYRNMIKNVGKTLEAYVDENRRLFHLSENIFLFYFKNYANPRELDLFSKEISDVLKKLLALELIDVGIGIVEIDKADFEEADRYISNALIASEESGLDTSGNICHSFFDREMENRVLRKELIKQELARIAIGENEDRLFLEFQPIIKLKDMDKVWGFEALARLRSDLLGRISPVEFIPIAEETKLIIPLGEILIKKAFNFQKNMEKAGYADNHTSINLSTIQLREETFYKKLLDMAEEYEIDLSKISFEITETALIENYSELDHTLEKLVKAGAGVAIDDFGTGYSSLARERELSISSVKMDKFFIDNLLTVESFDESIVGDIISMAHKLDNYVIAEGVENEAQMEYLRIKGCDGLQGHIISRSLKEKDVFKFMASYRSKGLIQRLKP